MGVQLNIKDGETIRMARDLAAASGQNITQAIKSALRDKITEQDIVDEERSARLLAIGRRCEPHLKPPYMFMEHGDILYDELGLPR